MSGNETWHKEETYRSLMQYGSSSIKFVLLVNGGAVIALLTFLGNIVTDSNIKMDMSLALGCFLFGIVCGGFANVTAYITQLKVYNEGFGRGQGVRHTFWLYATLVLIFIGIFAFCGGSLAALEQFSANS